MNAADSNQCMQCKQCSHKKRVVEDRSKRYEHTLGNFVVVLLIRFLMRNKWTHNHVPSLWVASVLKTRALNRTQPQLGEWTRGFFGIVCMFPKCESLDWNSHQAHILQKKRVFLISNFGRSIRFRCEFCVKKVVMRNGAARVTNKTKKQYFKWDPIRECDDSSFTSHLKI